MMQLGTIVSRLTTKRAFAPDNRWRYLSEEDPPVFLIERAQGPTARAGMVGALPNCCTMLHTAERVTPRQSRDDSI